jgi:hypothetical protein
MIFHFIFSLFRLVCLLKFVHRMIESFFPGSTDAIMTLVNAGADVSCADKGPLL